MTPPVVRCSGVGKRFGEIVAVEDVTFDLAQGEILAILGPSGCGKTTVLRLIAGFESIDRGEIFVQDRRVSGPSAHAPPETRSVGMVFQEYALFPHLTVAENVAFGLRRLTAAERHARVTEVMDLVRLDRLDARYPHELSGGQQQRVALARTLAPRPVTVMLDEPFSNLDATMRSEVRREVEVILRERDVATIFVTHDRDEAFAMADRIAIMREGRLEQIDTPDAIYRSPRTPFVARLTTTSDFLGGRVRDGMVHTEIGRLRWTNGGERFPEETDVDVLVHPDDFLVFPDVEGKGTIVSREFRGEEAILLVRLPSGTTLRSRQRPDSTVPIGGRVTLIPTRTADFVAFRAGDGE